jgi:ribonuclease HI
MLSFVVFINQHGISGIKGPIDMKQLSIFETHNVHANTWTLFVDGASRNNPGPSGAGIYILKNNILEIKRGYYLGVKTNNQAEYLALLLGLFILMEHLESDDIVKIISDSQLLVRQLIGMYKVRNPQLQVLSAVCKEKIKIMSATVSHVLREENGEADAMANQGIDNKIFPPKNYIAQLKHYDISL